MRFNGVDIRDVHPALSVNMEIYPGVARRDVITVRGNSGETLAGYQQERDEAVIRVNIAGKSKAEAMEVRALLAAWAASSGEQTAQLEPTHWPGKAYDAILSEIAPPEFSRGFATVDVTFILPWPYAYDVTESRASGGGEAVCSVGGTARIWPVIEQTLSAETSGLTWSADGKPFMRIAGSLHEGAVVRADVSQGSLTVDGVHQEAMIDYTQTTWQPGLTPGRHVVTSTDRGALEARWHNVWT